MDEEAEQIPRACRGGNEFLRRCTGGIGVVLELATAPFEIGMVLSILVVILGGMAKAG